MLRRVTVQRWPLLERVRKAGELMAPEPEAPVEEPPPQLSLFDVGAPAPQVKPGKLVAGQKGYVRTEEPLESRYLPATALVAVDEESRPTRVLVDFGTAGDREFALATGRAIGMEMRDWVIAPDDLAELRAMRDAEEREKAIPVAETPEEIAPELAPESAPPDPDPDWETVDTAPAPPPQSSPWPGDEAP